MRYEIVIGCLIFLAVATPGVAQETDGPSTAEWLERLGSARSEAERDTALAALRAIAGGLAGQAETREAAFGIAAYLADSAEDGRQRRVAVDALTVATSLYPDDDRTPAGLQRLVELLIESRDPFAAHGVFIQLIVAGHAEGDDRLLAQAAANAATARDPQTALRWLDRVDPERLDAGSRIWFEMARLKAGQATGRSEMALEAARELEQRAPDRLRVDADALLAAARVLEGVGLFEEAIRHYLTFINVHSRHPDHAATMLALGRLQATVGRLTRAERTLDWLQELYPDSREAHESRLAMVEMNGLAIDPSAIPGYVDVIRQAPDVKLGHGVCRMFVDRFIGAGYPLEAAGAVLDLIDDTDDGLAPFVARTCARESLDPIVDLLLARQDDVGIVGLHRSVAAAAVTTSPRQRRIFADARRRLGLPFAEDGPLERAVADARQEMAQKNWEKVVTGLEEALIVERDPHPYSDIEARLLLAEGLWRAQRSKDALAMARDALALGPRAREIRALRVLMADILFSDGQSDEACRLYEAAGESGSTRWVELQRDRCRQIVEASS